MPTRRNASRFFRQLVTNWPTSFSATWWQLLGGMASGFMKDSQLFSIWNSWNRSFELTWWKLIWISWMYPTVLGESGLISRSCQIWNFIRNKHGSSQFKMQWNWKRIRKLNQLFALLKHTMKWKSFLIPFLIIKVRFWGNRKLDTIIELKYVLSPKAWKYWQETLCCLCFVILSDTKNLETRSALSWIAS